LFVNALTKKFIYYSILLLSRYISREVDSTFSCCIFCCRRNL